jgi:peptidoglycan hydrolase CwlO-like protein
MKGTKLLLSKILLTCVLVGVIVLTPLQIYSASCEDSWLNQCNEKSDQEKLTCFDDVKRACEAKLAETGEKRQTLESAIAYLNTQITLTQSRINETTYQIEQLEEEISQLSGKINILNISLTKLSTLLLKRITATYKQTKIHPFSLFFSSKGFSDFISRYRYLKAAQVNDRQVIFEMEQARSNFDAQKTTKQEKQEQVLGLQTELVSQKSLLAQQQSAKKKVLEQTKNDEKKYQELLARTRAEFEAIQNVLAGQGDETEVGDVSEGQTIATIIPSASCNSDGPHLHFTIVQSGSVQNPFNFLKSVEYENCSGSECKSGDGDSFSPSGDWNWPIDSPVKFNQGYGDTWAIRNTWVGSIYTFHNGIDIFNDSLNVKAVKNGKLYRGSYVGSGGCTLRYVKVDHHDGDFETYYLHVNYI